jgi:two-component system response regulator MprA
VLIAEDDLELLEVVSRVIGNLGIETQEASTGGELLEKLAEHGPFDAVVTDVSMPWMTGLQVMHSARTAGNRCPIVVMTALRDAKTTASVAALGNDVVLIHKPFSIAQLKAALRSCLGKVITPKLAHA